MSFTGGKLKLKGGEPLKGSIDKKKKRKKSTTLAVTETNEGSQEQQVCPVISRVHIPHYSFCWSSWSGCVV